MIILSIEQCSKTAGSYENFTTLQHSIPPSYHPGNGMEQPFAVSLDQIFTKFHLSVQICF